MTLSEIKRLLLITLFCLFANVNSTPYLVHNLEEPTRIEHNERKFYEPVDIYCYMGTSKNLFALWQTVKLQIRSENDTFYIFMNEDPEIVYEEFVEKRHSWSSIPYLDMYEKTLSLSVFKKTCIAMKVEGRYSVNLFVQGVNPWRAQSMCVGIALICASQYLSSSPTFVYLCGITAGVFASYMFCVITIFLYYGGKNLLFFTPLPIFLYVYWNRLSNVARDIFPAGVICIGIILCLAIWDQIKDLLYTPATLLYTMYVSLVVCQNFRLPPILYTRNKSVVMLALQVLGFLLVFFSSEYQEAVAWILVISLCTAYWCGQKYLRVNHGIRREHAQGGRRNLITQPLM